MSTLTVYSDGEEAYIESDDATYSTARSGASLAANASQMFVGQHYAGSVYYCYQAFLAFDTSGAAGATVDSATLSLFLKGDATTDFQCQARLKDWGVSVGTADWVAGASLSGLTLLAYKDTAGMSAETRYDFTAEAAFATNINKAGETRLLLCSKEQVDNSAPTGNEYVDWYLSSYSGTTKDPRLVLELSGLIYPTTVPSSAAVYSPLLQVEAPVPKIVSPQGTRDVPAVITDTTPEITWTIPATQYARCIYFYDETDDAAAWNTGWTVTGTLTYTVPADHALTVGHTYSIQVRTITAAGADIYGTEENQYVHVNEATIAAPTLSAEADCDTADAIELAWSNPAVGDSDAIYPEIEISYGSTNPEVRTYLLAASATTFFVGMLPADTYSWRVRLVDEHGLEGTWAAADEFVVSQAGAVPTCALIALAASTTTAPRSTWTFTDPDGDPQDAYEIEVASDDGFSTIVEDSGVVASTDQYHDHEALAAGTYYRRLKVRSSSVDWSDWSATESFVIQAATTQSTAWQIYLNAEGVPAELSSATYPASGVRAVRRLGGVSEFHFTINNFDGLEGGIDDDEDVLLYLKDTAGKRVEFRGEVIDKQVNDMLTVTCEDIARKFPFWPVTRSLDNVTLGGLIEAIVENPSGSAATGIVAHCDEVAHPTVAGDVVRVASFQGQGRSLADWLKDFGDASGYTYLLESIAGTWHLYWFDAKNAPVSTCTMKDGIDYGAESTSQWRVINSPTLQKSRVPYRNRVRYFGRSAPPALPSGYASFDALMSEAVTDWAVWDAHYTLSADSTAGNVKVGTKCVKCVYAETPSADAAWPQIMPFCYFRVPELWRDMRSILFGEVRGYMKASGTRAGSAYWPATTSDPSPVGGWVIPGVLLFTDPGELAAGSWGTGTGTVVINGDQLWDADGYNMEWGAPLYFAQRDSVIAERLSHVYGIGFGVIWYTTALRKSGVAYTITILLDGLHIIGNPSYATKDAAAYIEAAEVTAGTETPIEHTLGASGMSLPEAELLARTYYTQYHRTQETISDLTLAGVRNVPLRRLIPVALTETFTKSGNYPLVAITYQPGEDGYKTILTLGDQPTDDTRQALFALVRKINEAKAEATT